MDQPTPKAQYDTIVIGTSLPNSILASSLSLNGSDVLHMDLHSSYGEWDGTMRVKRMVQMAGVRNGLQRERDRQILFGAQEENAPELTLRPGCTVVPVFRNPDDIFEGNEGEGEEHRDRDIGTSSQTHLHEHSSSWVCLEQLEISIPSTHGSYTALLECELDLCPKHLLCCERIVSLLASSSGGHYVNFTPVSAVYICMQEQDQGRQEQMTMVRVPCSRADVFQSDYLSLMEKRVLMKMLKQTAEDQDFSEDPYILYSPSRDTEFHSGSFQQNAFADESLAVEQDCSYASFLFKENVDKKIQDIVYHGIAFLDDDLQVIGKQKQTQARTQDQGNEQNISMQMSKILVLKRISTFLRSLTRFSGTSTPFLITNHGSAELCQAFCRIAAVRGATYMLRTGIKGLVLNEEKRCVGVVSTDNQAIYARRHVFISSNMYQLAQPNAASPEPRQFFYRLIGIRNMAVSFNAGWEKEQFIAIFPPMSRTHNRHLVRMYQHKTITRSRDAQADAFMFTMYAESADKESILTILDYMSRNASVAVSAMAETEPGTSPGFVNHNPFLLRVILKLRASAGATEPGGLKLDSLDFVDNHYTSMAINSDLQVREAAIQFHKVFPTVPKYWNP